jgi:gas vesicle protein
MADNKCAGDFVAGFLVGALVGAAAAVLLAPQSGEETRTMLRDRGVELGQRAEELSLQAKDRAGEYQTRMKQAVDEGKAAAAKRKEDLLTQVSKEPPAEEIPTEA